MFLQWFHVLGVYNTTLFLIYDLLNIIENNCFTKRRGKPINIGLFLRNCFPDMSKEEASSLN